jgi:glycosyltransferase involved in cell wall biosynthesis
MSFKFDREALNILLVAPAGIGGIQTFCTAISEGFCNAGHRVHIVFEQQARRAESWPKIPAGVEVSVIEHQPFQSYYHVIKRMADFIRSGRFDVVYANTSSVAYRALGLLGPSRPVAVGGCLSQTPHDYNTNQEFLEFLDHIFTDGHLAAEELARRLGDSTVGIMVIPHGFTPTVSPGARLSSGPIRLVFVGRLVPSKRIQDMIAVAQRLRDRGIPFEFAVVGEGPVRSELQSQTRSLGLQSNVVFYGFQEQDRVDKLLQASHVSFLLSETEGFGISALEAMSFGCVPVVTDTCGCKVAIQDSVNGFVVSLGNVEAVTERICQVHYNRELLTEMSKEAIKSIQREYSREKEIERHLELIDKARLHHLRCASGTAAWRFVPPGYLDHPWVPMWFTQTLRKAKRLASKCGKA